MTKKKKIISQPVYTTSNALSNVVKSSIYYVCEAKYSLGDLEHYTLHLIYKIKPEIVRHLLLNVIRVEIM